MNAHFERIFVYLSVLAQNRPLILCSYVELWG